MNCPKCKFENPEGMKFCGECGAKLEKFCPGCGYSNPPQFKFCGECGYDLKTPKEPATIDYSAPQSYTPKHLADKILTTRSSIEGERKLVTVMFADVANYTSVSEKLDPEEVHQMMDGAFKILVLIAEGSLGLLQQGERLAKELGDERSLAWFYNSMGIYYSHKGDPQLAMKYSEDAFEKARKNRDIELMAPLAFGLSVSYDQAGEYYKIVEIAPDVIDLIEKTERESAFFSLGMNPHSTLCSFCGQGMGYLGDFDEGKTFLEKGLRNASEINDVMALGVIETQCGYFYRAKGNWEPSKEHFEKGIKHSEEAKYAVISALSWSGLGYACAMLGDGETGKRHAEKGLEIHRDSGVEAFLSLAHYQLGWIHLDLGDPKNARSFAEEALRLSQKNNEKYIEGLSWLLLGRIWGKTEPLELNKAEECLLKGIEICKKLRIKPYYSLGHLYLGELYLNGGEKEKAMDNLKKAEGMFREMGMDYWLGKTQEVLARL